MTHTKPIDQVRKLIETERHGILSTLSRKLDGWPFGSVTPYCLGAASQPLILISDIAEHTRNLRGDARVSLTVQDANALADPAAGARVTLIGYAIPVAPPWVNDARHRYLGRFPQSGDYFAAHDFSLYQIRLRKIRYIGGFGEIHWLDGGELLTPADPAIDPVAQFSESIREHMNHNHRDALVSYAAVLGDLPATRAELVDVDSLGFDLIAVAEGSHRHLRIEFEVEARTPEEIRRRMIALSEQVRNWRSGD